MHCFMNLDFRLFSLLLSDIGTNRILYIIYMFLSLIDYIRFFFSLATLRVMCGSAYFWPYYGFVEYQKVSFLC